MLRTVISIDIEGPGNLTILLLQQQTLNECKHSKYMHTNPESRRCYVILFLTVCTTLWAQVPVQSSNSYCMYPYLGSRDGS